MEGDRMVLVDPNLEMYWTKVEPYNGAEGQNMVTTRYPGGG